MAFRDPVDVAGLKESIRENSAAAAHALAVAHNAKDIADNKITTYYQNNEPQDAKEGDWWFDGEHVYILHNGNWELVQDAGITEAIQKAATAQATADKKITTYFLNSGNSPNTPKDGDIWIVKDKDNLIRRYNGAQWIDLPYGTNAIQTAGIKAANMALGIGGNIIPDPGFNDAAWRLKRANDSPNGHFNKSGNGDWYAVNDKGVNWSLELTADLVPAQHNDVFYFEAGCDIFGSNENIRLQAHVYKFDGSKEWFNIAITKKFNGFQKIEGRLQMPSSTTGFVPRLNFGGGGQQYKRCYRVAVRLVTTNQLLDDNAVDFRNMRNNSIDHPQMRKSAIWHANIADHSVDANNLRNDSVDNPAIRNNAVHRRHIADNSIDYGMMRGDAVGDPTIRNNAIHHRHMAKDSVGTRAIWGRAIGDTELKQNAVGNYQMENHSISARNLVKFLHLVTNITVTLGELISNQYREAEDGWKLSNNTSQFKNVNVISHLGAHAVSAEDIIFEGEGLHWWFNHIQQQTLNNSNNPVAFGDWTKGGDSAKYPGGSIHWIWAVNYYMPAGVSAMVYVDVIVQHLKTTYGQLHLDIGGHKVFFNRKSTQGVIHYSIAYPLPNPANGNRILKIGYRTGGGSNMWKFRAGGTQPARAVIISSGNKMMDRSYRIGNPNPPQPPKRTFTKTFTAAWHRSWNGNGTIYDNHGREPNQLMQGYYDATHGRTKSACGFTVASGLPGDAEITNVRVSFRCKHTYYNAGTTFRMWQHNAETKPANFPIYGGRLLSVNLAEGARDSWNLPNYVGNHFKDGSTGGFSFRAPNNSRSYYGYLYPDVKVTITYKSRHG